MAFDARLAEARAQIAKPGFEWYPYDSLGNFFSLDQLLTGPRRFLLDLIGSTPVLDVGCADGHSAFFLESLGCRVVAVDNPDTNFNLMQGVRALKKALGSEVDIFEQDIDLDFALPGDRYSVALLLGVLYHLKNPINLLEILRRQVRYLILSTRVARVSPGHDLRLEGLPVGYLVSGDETNNDPTNFWIFTNAGLHRLLERSGWRIVDYLNLGNTTDSDPVSWQGDERAFVFAERAQRQVTSGRVLRGWHEQQELEDWRWTERVFSVAFDHAPLGPHPTVWLEFHLPEAIGEITISATINGQALPSRRYTGAGDHTYREPVKVTVFPAVVEFSLDRALGPSVDDLRELGIVVSGLRLI